MSNKFNTPIFITLLIGISIFTWGYFNINRFSTNVSTSENILPEAIKLKINNTDETSHLLSDTNTYLITKDKSTIVRKAVPKIGNKILETKMKENSHNLVIIDIREKYEQSLLELLPSQSLRYIRFGDLINNSFKNVPKNAEIIIVGFTNNREIVAASYLISQEYTNVKILNGGILQWFYDKLPLEKNGYKSINNPMQENISSELKKYSQDEINQSASSSAILKFHPSYSPDNISMLLWDSKTLTQYINSLSSNSTYILSCRNEFNLSCWEALYFWYIVKDKITVLGYTLN